jgi:hypothetical protein
MEQIRVYIADGTFDSRVSDLLNQWQGNAERERKAETYTLDDPDE